MMCAMIQFNLPSMSCGHCVAAVTQAVKSVDPQAQVDVDLGTHTVRVQSSQPADALVRALTDAGYRPS